MFYHNSFFNKQQVYKHPSDHNTTLFFNKQQVYKHPSDHKLLSNFQELALFV